MIMTIEPIKIIQPININPVASVHTEVYEQSEELGGDRLSDFQRRSEEYIASKKEIEKKEKEKVVHSDFNEISEKLKSILGEDNLIINFSLDEDTKKMIMQVIDSKTNEVVQQFPPEIALKVARIVANTLENWNIADAQV